ncbi:hypothetical protein E2562_025476 [Oryza meyeriana var. granulata]|uniref:Uncharacterized protein n=1 Tax=Oryza meyeriana var. granulata TaxID=110450 RepID=A0A6G1CIE4_9ORYZ|nr:hypothetical protein E2562_025476 [Oryza meyeriana var. granulata]
MAQQWLQGLCFNWLENFFRDHLKHCTIKGIYLMEVKDGETNDNNTVDTDIEISLLTLVGINMGYVMQLAISIRGSTLHAMVDTSSTHHLIAIAIAIVQCLNLHPEPRTFDIDIYVMDLASNDMSMAFWHHGHQVQWFGIAAAG